MTTPADQGKHKNGSFRGLRAANVRTDALFTLRPTAPSLGGQSSRLAQGKYSSFVLNKVRVGPRSYLSAAGLPGPGARFNNIVFSTGRRGALTMSAGDASAGNGPPSVTEADAEVRRRYLDDQNLFKEHNVGKAFKEMAKTAGVNYLSASAELKKKQISEFDRILNRPDVDNKELQKAINTALIKSNFIESLKHQIEAGGQAKGEQQVDTVTKEAKEEPPQFEVKNNPEVAEQRMLIDFIENNMSTEEIEQMVRSYQSGGQAETEAASLQPEEPLASEPRSQKQEDMQNYSGKISEVLNERRRLGTHLDRLQALIEQNVDKLSTQMSAELLEFTQAIHAKSRNMSEENRELKELIRQTVMVLNEKGVDVDLASFTDLDDAKEEPKMERKPEQDQGLTEMSSTRLDEMIKERVKQLDAFLADEEVLSTFGPVEVVQMKNIVDRMRKECQSQTELLILNDKLLHFLIESHRFKSYEKDKEQMMKDQGDDIDKQLKEFQPGASSGDLDESSKAKWNQMAKEKQDYSKFLSNMNPNNAHEIATRVIVMRDLQLKRIEYFLSLDRNKNSEMRMEAIQEYKEHLEKLSQASVDILKQLVQKGNTMEHWQDYLDKLVAEVGDHGDDGYDSRKKQEEFMKKVIEENMNLAGEIRGIQVNGNEVRGIESTGWGSMAKIEVDNETGEVKKSAERFPSPQDQLFADLYIKYLEESFTEMNETNGKDEEKDKSEDPQPDDSTVSPQNQTSTPAEISSSSKEVSDHSASDEDSAPQLNKTANMAIDIESKILQDLRCDEESDDNLDMSSKLNYYQNDINKNKNEQDDSPKNKEEDEGDDQSKKKY